ncbi:MAG TPA: oligoendopeptidase F, partial [Bacteroidetes bacterium]|nr:oligoendopeptidase F [Bacteroidota bacterium]HEX05636.1 oligoendopeptidase F [Bacteroidota bacterium]
MSGIFPLASPEQNTGSGYENRDDIDPRYRWDLNNIYTDLADWEKDCKSIKDNIQSLASIQGSLKDGPEELLRFLQLSDSAGRLFDRVWYFPGLAFDLDQRNNELNARKQLVEDLSAQYATSTSWFDPELIAIGQATIHKWMNNNNSDLALYRFHLDEIFRQAEHVLDEDGEQLMALSARFGSTPSQTYSMLTTADATFPEVELSDGSKRKITPGTYSSLLRTLPKQDDREKIFRAHFGLYQQFTNTYASIYNGILQRGWFNARARGYANVLESKLHRFAIPSSVVHTLVESARNGMEPLRRYHKIRRKALGVEKYYLYDSFAALIQHETRYEYGDAEKQIIASVAPLGKDYQATV